MPIDFNRIRDCLKQFDFQDLFVQELGWDLPPANVSLTIGGQGYLLRAVAQKRGLVVYECTATDTESIPDSTLGRKIDRELTKQTHEHIIIFTDAARTTQVWQWVKREAGAALACRRHTYHVGQPGESLLQKLDKLFVSLDEEEGFSIVDAAGRVRSAFDVERITKRFFERFQAEHGAFLSFVKGIREQGDREWYASLMLNRLMFIYFIQKRRFLDGDVDYLRNRLARVRLLRGKDKFHSFYRQFLLRLFHEGLGKPPHEREPELEVLLGEVPYLNGGLFDQHELERANPNLEIPDRAFERVFAFFEEFDWTLEPRSPAFYAAHPRAREEINPDILGYIFEKYINQKEMGAYYTKEDITDYIAKNTIIPFLLDAARKDCAVAFDAGRPLWRLLQETPDRYLYHAVRQGVIDGEGRVIPLADEIAAGLDDVSRRAGWNKPAGPPYALPTETWREHVARRRRSLELRAKLAAGEVHEINDLVTCNLDIRRFALDAVEYCEGPEFLRAFYRALERVSVLDPTCGSGAFLFAALNVLEPLYETCLDRMREFVDDADASGTKRRKEAVADFRQTLDRVAAHPSREYFIHKSIVVNNLYGVDIMEEAIEICKLRLFLKLVAQVDDVRHLEPLPDIDFNIRAGNTLVGFTSLDEIRKSQEGKFAFSAAEVARIEIDARAVDKRFCDFRRCQTTLAGIHSSSEIAAAKAALRGIQAELARRLDVYLAGEYGIDASDAKKAKEFAAWQVNHRPFHWFVEFYGALSSGGFSVVIGNPPYVEYSKVRRVYQIKGFKSERCGNLYAPCSERSFDLLRDGGRFGFIVQAPIVSTQRMAAIRFLLTSGSDNLAWSTFDDRPAKLFDGMHHCRLAIILARRTRDGGACTSLTTKYHKWYEEERENLFAHIAYEPVREAISDCIPKFRSDLEFDIWRKMIAGGAPLGELLREKGSDRIFYKITGVGHWFTFTTTPPAFWRDGVKGNSTRENSVAFVSAAVRDMVFCSLWSALHYWFYQARTNCRDFNPSDLETFLVPKSIADGSPETTLLAKKISACLDETSQTGAATYAVGGAVRYQRFRPKFAKSLFDEGDRILASHYNLTAEELDFIINYDIKYRMGRDAQDDGSD
ncbi:MAG TPA: DNA methyltransferase [Pirellulales bacterium]|nr:DNA methyltransferase [Pirellulales bacterium]